MVDKYDRSQPIAYSNSSMAKGHLAANNGDFAAYARSRWVSLDDAAARVLDIVKAKRL
jgi:hypothetical protein